MSSLFVAFTSRLEQAGVQYMVTGSVAGMIYGEPRLTHDVDIVLELDDDAIERLAELFPDEEFYFPPADVIRVEVRRAQRGHFNIIEHRTGFKADIYLVGRDPLHRWAMRNRSSVELEGHRLRVAPPEYVIVRKLEYYREGQSEKHLTDVRGMLRHSRDGIDHDRLGELIASMGLEDEWQLVGEI